MVTSFNLLNPSFATRTELDFSALYPLFVGVVDDLGTGLVRVPRQPTGEALLPGAERTRNLWVVLTASHYAFTVWSGAETHCRVCAQLSSILEPDVLLIELRD
jgi:hypothetical protein